MGLFGNRTDRINERNANIRYERGNLDYLGWHLCKEQSPVNFAICGDSTGAFENDKYLPLLHYLELVVGRIPVIVIHNNSIAAENILQSACEGARMAGRDAPLWIINNYSRGYEPFLDMTDAQVVSSLTQIARNLGYDVTPRFERVIRAHIRIIRAVSVEKSLTWFYYLASFDNIAEFHENVFDLPCSRSEAEGIWADLCVDSIEFDLFRTVIRTLASECEECGWDPGSAVGKLNCQRAILENAVLSISANSAYSDTFLAYLSEELRQFNNRQFVMIFDNIPISNQSIADIIINNRNAFFGFISDNLNNTFNGDDVFSGVMEKMETFIIFKHSTSTAADAVSQLIGTYERIKEETSYGNSKENGKIFVRDRRKDVRYSIEDMSRVRPEDIIGLGRGQAIVYDALENTVVYFN